MGGHFGQQGRLVDVASWSAFWRLSLHWCVGPAGVLRLVAGLPQAPHAIGGEPQSEEQRYVLVAGP